MFRPTPEERFRVGLTRLADDRVREAMVLFKEAIDLAKTIDDGGRWTEGRYYSYYGLCLCLTRASTREALRSCRIGVTLDPEHPNVWWNLGRVALRQNRRAEAYRAWSRGLALAPDHDGMQAGLDELGVRRRPVLPWVRRGHPVNVVLGLARARLERPARVAWHGRRA